MTNNDMNLAGVPALLRAHTLQEALAYTDAAGAENALAALAHVEGDSAVVQLIGEMLPIHLNKVSRNFDYTKPSCLAELMTPEQIAHCLKTEPSFWSDASQPEELDRIQQHAESYLCALVLTSKDESRRREILHAILETHWGIAFLCLVLARFEQDLDGLESDDDDYQGVLVIEKDKDESPNEGEWSELLYVLKELCPEGYRVVRDDLGVRSEENASETEVVRYYVNNLKEYAADEKAHEIGIADLFMPLHAA